MKRLIQFGLFVFLFSSLTGCNGQTKTNSPAQKQSDKKKLVGGGCDGCEIMFVGMPTNISSVDTGIGWTRHQHQMLSFIIGRQTTTATIHPQKEWTKKQNATDTFGVG
jgi:protocatechuate 3,4-dioxygenase, beta subunit